MLKHVDSPIYGLAIFIPDEPDAFELMLPLTKYPESGRIAPLCISSVRLSAPVMLAPMTGISDVPFRNLAQRLGAPLVFSEMVAGKEQLRGTAQSDRMASFDGTARPHAIQLAGRDPATMAEAAKFNEDRGVDLIDINFGCPAKKVVGGLGGAAILRDERLAARILTAVVEAVDLPVTLKYRLGWDDASRNAPTIARVAEDCGIRSLTLHGRTRSQFYEGQADWRAIAEVKASTCLPLIANGDIVDVDSARRCLESTGADGIMVGRAAQGRPWLPGQLAADLIGLPAPKIPDLPSLIRDHLQAMVGFYGEVMGLRIARKHIASYLAEWPVPERRLAFNRFSSMHQVEEWLGQLQGDRESETAKAA